MSEKNILITITPNSVANVNRYLEITDKLILESAENYYIRGNNCRLSILGYNDVNEKEKLINAINFYTKAIELRTSYIDAWFWRGYAKRWLADKKTTAANPAFIYLANYADALEDYNKVIELDPNYAEAFSARGDIKGFLQDHAGAIEDCNKAIELNPNYVDAFCIRGTAKLRAKDYRGAIEDFEKAIELGASDFFKDIWLKMAKEKLNEKTVK